MQCQGLKKKKQKCPVISCPIALWPTDLHLFISYLFEIDISVVQFIGDTKMSWITDQLPKLNPNFWTSKIFKVYSSILAETVLA